MIRAYVVSKLFREIIKTELNISQINKKYV